MSLRDAFIEAVSLLDGDCFVAGEPLLAKTISNFLREPCSASGL